jgi:hypothetical protein
VFHPFFLRFCAYLPKNASVVVSGKENILQFLLAYLHLKSKKEFSGWLDFEDATKKAPGKSAGAKE